MSLHHDVVRFRQATFADTTRRTYRTHRKTYIGFCQALGVLPIPATTHILCLFAAYLARFLLPKSILLYLNFMGRQPHIRSPMTPDLLLGIRSRLNLTNSFHVSFWAICLTAFFGLFRKAHLLPASRHQFDSHKQLTHLDFVLHDIGYIVTVR